MNRRQQLEAHIAAGNGLFKGVRQSTSWDADSMQRWYKDALIETWRKPEYEQAAIANGKIVHDFRG